MATSHFLQMILPSFSVASVAAVLAGVQADAVRATVLSDDDEAHDGVVLGLVFEAVQVAVLDLAEGDEGDAVLERVGFRRRKVMV